MYKRLIYIASSLFVTLSSLTYASYNDDYLLSIAIQESRKTYMAELEAQEEHDLMRAFLLSVQDLPAGEREEDLEQSPSADNAQSSHVVTQHKKADEEILGPDKAEKKVEEKDLKSELKSDGVHRNDVVVQHEKVTQTVGGGYYKGYESVEAYYASIGCSCCLDTCICGLGMD